MGSQAFREAVLCRLRWVLGLFILALVLSGLTAFPLQQEIELLAKIRNLEEVGPSEVNNSFDRWVITVRGGLRQSYMQNPWLAYGTDWLAFAHLVLAVFFIGPLVNPVRNIWTLDAGLVACVLVVPMALIGGPIRGIPLGWRLFDCSFGILGALPLYYCLRLAKALEKHLAMEE